MRYEVDGEYIGILIAWLVVLAVLLRQAWFGRRPLAGLSVAYWANLWLIHWVAGFIQCLPWHEGPYPQETIVGFKITGYAMAGLVIGNVLLTSLFVPGGMQRIKRPVRIPNSTFAIKLMSVGLLCWSILGVILGRVPSLNAVLSSGMLLAVAGFCMLIWTHWHRGQRGRVWLITASSILLPIVSLLMHGFLGYGAAACINVAAFFAVVYRPRRTVVMAALAGLFVCFSLYPSYMAARQAIRQVVWGGASYQKRIEVTSTSIGKEWEWFDLRQKAQLEAIESRLNQNRLLGRADQYIRQGNASYAEGETLWNSLQALVPRIIWPGKPAWAGSRGMVTRYTGIEFAASTSVGIGHIMELYVNFGRYGVLVGFVLIGLILGILDRICGHFMVSGRWDRWALGFVVGLTLMQVGGNFAEATAAAAGATALVLVVNHGISNGHRGDIREG